MIEGADPFVLIERHIEAIKAASQEAWRHPEVAVYEVGAVVWMFDHYNTAIVEGPGIHHGWWKVKTWDASGDECYFVYRSSWLRPAAAVVQFRWADAETAAAGPDVTSVTRLELPTPRPPTAPASADLTGRFVRPLVLRCQRTTGCAELAGHPGDCDLEALVIEVKAPGDAG